jgi:hypothetical protein
MTNMMLVDLALESLTPSVNAQFRFANYNNQSSCLYGNCFSTYNVPFFTVMGGEEDIIFL